jgi:hypothetical protein
MTVNAAASRLIHHQYPEHVSTHDLLDGLVRRTLHEVINMIEAGGDVIDR